jgi:xylulokinase
MSDGGAHQRRRVAPVDAVMGIDIGTYSSKGVVCSSDGAILAEARIEHGVSIPEPGRMEQDADAVWWHDFVALSRQLAESLSAEVSIVAVGLSAIGPCLLPLDGDGRPLRPAILYGADIRAAAQIDRLEARFGPALRRFSGTRLTSQAVGPKILWLAGHEPEVFSRTATLLTAAGYLVYRLTGELAIDHHNGSYFAPFYDLRQACWDLRFAEGAVPSGLLPPLRWPGEIAGRVTAEAATVTGLPVGTPVTAGTTDGAAEATGVGVLEPGDLMISYGSTSALVLVVDRPRPVPPLWLTRGSWPDEFVLTAALATSGSITSWLREQFARELAQGTSDEIAAAHATLTREAEASPIGAGGLLVLPYFSGERSPFNDPRARGVIAGLTLSHRRGDVYRAILEATAFGLRHNLEAMAASGTRPKRAVAVGGGTATRLWPQIVSDVTGLTQELPDRATGAALGDAYIAATAVGLVERGAGRWVRTVDRVTPVADRAATYDARYRLYRDLYRQSRFTLHALAGSA